MSIPANSRNLAAGSHLLVLSWQTCFVQRSSLKAVTLVLSLAVLDDPCYVLPDL